MRYLLNSQWKCLVGSWIYESNIQGMVQEYIFRVVDLKMVFKALGFPRDKENTELRHRPMADTGALPTFRG